MSDLNVSLLFINIFSIILLFFGSYGTFRGALEISYSIKELLSIKKKEKNTAFTDVLLLVTTVLGLVLIVLQSLFEVLPIFS